MKIIKVYALAIKYWFWDYEPWDEALERTRQVVKGWE